MPLGEQRVELLAWREDARGERTSSIESEIPKPERSELTRFFWDGVDAGRLVIQRCSTCSFYVHWPRHECSHCHSESLVPTEVSGRGTVYSYGVATQAFASAFQDRIPYVLAVVELEEQAGLKLVTNIVDCDEEAVEVGMSVEVVFREADQGLTLPYFRPANEDLRA